jgi:hypothetical protein
VPLLSFTWQYILGVVLTLYKQPNLHCNPTEKLETRRRDGDKTKGWRQEDGGKTKEDGDERMETRRRGGWRQEDRDTTKGRMETKGWRHDEGEVWEHRVSISKKEKMCLHMEFSGYILGRRVIGTLG